MVQFALLVIIRYDSNKEAMALYIVVWLLSQVFGVCSTLAAMFLYPAFVPPLQKGKYMGVRNSLTSAVECTAPVMLALIYQTGSLATGDDRAAQLDLWSNVCLAVCGTISALAFLGYLPVPRLLPKPPPKAAGASKPTDPLKVAPASDAARKPLSHYDNVGWQEWTSLSTNERYEIRQARVREGMPPPYFVWGTWDDDMPLASELLAKAPSEMGEIRAKYTEVVTDDAKLAARQLSRGERGEQGEAGGVACGHGPMDRRLPRRRRLRAMGGGAAPVQGDDHECLPAHRHPGREAAGYQGPRPAAHELDGAHEGARPARDDRTDHIHCGPD